MKVTDKNCRFCKIGHVVLLHAATKIGSRKRSQEFACTNCGFGIHGPIVRCDSCQIVYDAENISQKQISTYYEVADDPLYFAEQPARGKTFATYLSKLERMFPHKGKLLDIGTNTGLFVRLAKDHGWDAYGLEPNRWAVKYAREHYGIDLINKPFEKGVFKKDSFDVITMWDVIEHFTDPVSEMVKVRWYLRPGGLFAFSTVDPDSPLAKLMGTNWSWYMAMHRVFFNRSAAGYYLHRSGFKDVVFKPHWRKLSLGYLASRLQAISPVVSNYSQALINSLHLSKIIVPYYANDLYDCYAFK